MARRVSGSATTAVEEKTRKLVQRPSSRPPPKAVLEMAEMVGMGRVERRVKVLRSESRKSRVLEVVTSEWVFLWYVIESGVLFRREA